jgi:hypothetical protein
MGPECPTQNCRDLNKKTLLPNQRSYIQTHAYDLYNLIYIQYIYIKYKSKIFNVSTLTQRLHPSYWFLHRSCATSSVAFHSSLKTILDCSCTMLFFLNLILSIFFFAPSLPHSFSTYVPRRQISVRSYWLCPGMHLSTRERRPNGPITSCSEFWHVLTFYLQTDPTKTRESSRGSHSFRKAATHETSWNCKETIPESWKRVGYIWLPRCEMLWDVAKCQVKIVRLQAGPGSEHQPHGQAWRICRS